MLTNKEKKKKLKVIMEGYDQMLKDFIENVVPSIEIKVDVLTTEELRDRCGKRLRNQNGLWVSVKRINERLKT